MKNLPIITANCSNYADIVLERAKQTPERPAYSYLENGTTATQSLNYRELSEQCQRGASRLQEYDCSGERVLLIMRSDLDYSIAFLTCMLSGATAVTTIVPSTAEQVRRLSSVASNALPKFAILRDSDREKLADLFAAHPTLQDITLISYEELALGDRSQWERPDTTWNDPAFLQYTSGSTSSPKGVIVTHQNLKDIGAYHEEVFGMHSEDIGITWLPQSHDMGLIHGVLQPLYSGYPSYIMTPTAFLKRPLNWLKAISKYRISVTIAPNFAFDLCVESVKDKDWPDLDLSNLTCIHNAAEPIRLNSYEAFAETFARVGFRKEALGSAYGMAESTLAVTSTRRSELYAYKSVDAESFANGIATDQLDPKRKSLNIVGCGTPAGEVKLCIAEPNSLTELPPNHVGELLLQGPIITQGYWNNDTATHEAFQLNTTNGNGPYFRTGDLAFIDETGELFITGRTKDLIIINGKNHSPQDIELTTEEKFFAIRPRQVSCFSIQANDAELVVVIAEIKRECTRDTNPETLAKQVMKHLAREHQIPIFEIVIVKRGECPKTTSGKIQRQRSKHMYLNQEYTVVTSFRNPMFKNTQASELVS
ncbi:fatty acyl-AMP ligase [Rubritalea marina]|uniref:fatty acyl-AMP ligase n=1 Tax=Rubritalea marina TaxID=361055 RepID=UPI000381F91B|nr:fatty acyl-AMP ligase [Rubritalea marina]